MSTRYLMPTENAVQDMLRILFGNDLAAKTSESPDVAAGHMATYIDNDSQVVAACACDVAFVAYAGAALSMIPADVARNAINSNDLTEAMLGNFHEVMNICSRMLMSNITPHLRLDKTLRPEAAGAVAAGLNGAAKAASFCVTIPGYGDGLLTFLVT